MPGTVWVTEIGAPAFGGTSLKTIWKMPADRPEAWSTMSSVQVLVCGLPTAGTVGVKLIASVCEAPRLSKYSTVTGSAVPLAPASVSVAGRLALSCDGRGRLRRDRRAVDLHRHEARGAVARLRPGCCRLRSAGQPSSTSPEGVRR